MNHSEAILPERAPSLGVALRFFIAGLLFLATLLLTAIWKAPLLRADYLHNPATLAVTHLFTLGLGGSVVSGALYQMLPVLLHSRLFSERLANLHLVLHTLGVAAMVWGFVEFHTWSIITGGSLVYTGALLLVTNLGLTFRKAERQNWHGAFMGLAILFYLATLTYGLLMALNQRFGFWGEVEGATLNAHLTLGFLGWFSLLIVGVALKLVPMFAPAKSLPPRLVAGAGLGLATGVLTLLTGLYTSRILTLAGYTLTTAALLTYSGIIAYTYLHRRSGPLDFSVRFTLTGALLLPIPLLLLPWAPRAAQAGLVFFFALAFVGSTILGMLLRIIPFMVWLHRFRNRTHKQEKIPFLHEMFRPYLGWAAYLTWFPAVALMALGLALEHQLPIILGAVIALAGLAPYGIALRQTLHHVPPGTPALFPGKPK